MNTIVDKLWDLWIPEFRTTPHPLHLWDMSSVSYLGSQMPAMHCSRTLKGSQASASGFGGLGAITHMRVVGNLGTVQLSNMGLEASHWSSSPMSHMMLEFSFSPKLCATLRPHPWEGTLLTLGQSV